MWRQTESGREGGGKVREKGWGWGVLRFFSWNSAPRVSAAARKSRKTEALFYRRRATFFPSAFSPFSCCGCLKPMEEGGQGGQGDWSAMGGFQRWGRAGAKRGEGSSGDQRKIQHFVPPMLLCFQRLCSRPVPLQCPSQSTSESDHESPLTHLYAR